MSGEEAPQDTPDKEEYGSRVFMEALHGLKRYELVKTIREWKKHDRSPGKKKKEQLLENQQASKHQQNPEGWIGTSPGHNRHSRLNRHARNSRGRRTSPECMCYIKQLMDRERLKCNQRPTGDVARKARGGKA